ncbi:unnamed protein product [Rotaria sordida]|uniref:MATH domain-containing protein n=2 Tax=Rotaria sordida TaxID=392033 RepID=A0A818GP11_9BILA|nr:unnamed protein product [Rotaria sordida]
MLDRGCQLDMEQSNIICSLCDWNGIFKNYQEHLDKVHINPSCEFCGKQFQTVDSLTQHVSICEKVTLNCILKPYGCNEQFLRMNIRDHFLSQQHQNVLLRFLTQNIQHPINDKEDESTMSCHTTITTYGGVDETSHVSLQQLFETMDILIGGLNVINDDTQRLTSESFQYQHSLQSVSEDASKLKIAIEATHSSINAHRTNQQILEESLNSCKQQLDDQKNISIDGTLLWKITNLQQKIDDAQCERQTSIYSPIFYSSPSGYKMRLRLYLAGNGNGRRTHMSLFFVLMRGEYDAILHFPFSFKVIFILLDQTSQQRHIFDSFRPDVKSSSFQRPHSDMNIASGIPKFVPLTIIQQDNNPYVVDDTMFIKTIVDFGDIPKPSLPYALSLNPGLPILTQRELLKRELEKRAQEKLSATTDAPTSIKHDVRTNRNGTALSATCIYDSGAKLINDHTIIYSGLSSDNKTRNAYGVAIYLDQTATKIKLKFSQINIIVIAVYSPVYPTNTQMADESDKFYADLQDTAKMRIEGELPDSFLIETGVQQDGIPSPILFNILFDFIIRKVTEEAGIGEVKFSYGSNDFFHAKRKTTKILTS